MSTEQTQAEHSALFAEVTRRLTRAAFKFAQENRTLAPMDVGRALMAAATTLATAAEGRAGAAALLRALAAELERDADQAKPN